MLSKNWCVVLIVLGLAMFAGSSTSAASGGAKGFRAGGGAAVACGARHGDSGQFFRQNGVFGPTWAYGNSYWGWGGIGLGCVYPGWGYQLEGVPYFAQFPPVYYGNGENVPVSNTSIRPSWVGGERGQATPEFSASASPPRPPLRIVNPYYVEAIADKP
ncbi:MAG: hypothetical protein ABSG53_02660 [Thermoguttaceae bacterium]|jgi:hypothetical protein